MGVNAVEAYKNAWGLYRKNLKTYLISAFVLMVVSFVIIVPLVLLHLVLVFTAVPASQMNPLMPPLIIAADVLVLLLAVLLSGIFKGAYFGICYDIIQEEKIGWKRLFHWAKVRWQTFCGITVIQLIAVLLVMVPFVIFGMLLANSLNNPFAALAVTIVSVPFLLFISSIIEFSFPKTVAEFTGTVESVSGAFGILKADPVQFVILLALTLLMSIIGIIPFAGQLIVTPLQDTAFSLFYLAGKKPKRKR